MKLVHFYVYDNCDDEGLWPINYDELEAKIGETIYEEDLRDFFHGEIVKIADGREYLRIPRCRQYWKDEQQEGETANV